VVFGTITLLAIYLIARAITQSRAAAMTTLALFALYPADIAFTSVTLSQAVFNMLALAGCALCLSGFHRSSLQLMAAGALLAWATLTRHQGAVLVVLIVAAWAVQSHKPSRWKDCLLLTSAFMICAAPWTVRNAVELQAFVPISTNGGINLYIGNNPRANGRYNVSPRILAPLQTAVHGAMRGGHNELLIDRKASRLAWEYARREPRAALALWPRKLSALYSHDDGFTSWLRKLPEPAQFERLERIKRLSEPYYRVLIGCGIAGVLIACAALARGQRSFGSMIWLPAAVVLSFTALHLLTFGSPTYHHPMMPWVAISAGYAITAPYRGRRSIARCWRELTRALR
jgi:hypothetical protein